MSLPTKRILRSSIRHATVKVPEPDKSKISGLSLATVVISAFGLTGAISIWVLKNAGISYRSGYLVSYGLRPDALPWSADDLVSLGYYALVDLLVVTFGLFAGFAIFLAVTFFAINWVSHFLSNGKVKKSTRTTPNKSPNLISLEVIICYVAAIVFFTLLFFSALPLTLFKPAREKGESDARAQISAIREWNVGELKNDKLSFVEMTREKAEPITGVVVSCTEKFCGVYSPVGPVHTHMVPLTDIKTWSRIEWEDVPASERTNLSRRPIPSAPIAASLSAASSR